KCGPCFEVSTLEYDDNTDIAPEMGLEQSFTSTRATTKPAVNEIEAPPDQEVHITLKRKRVADTVEPAQGTTGGVRITIDIPKKKRQKVAADPPKRPTTPDKTITPNSLHSITHSPGWRPINCSCASPLALPTAGQSSME
ncbi:MAG: hypothetical protein Q9224_004592, partial [Gallowayella concinna]